MGELFKNVWRKTKQKERQLRAVYNQIGIDPRKKYSVEELEAHIIYKSINDYNSSKLNTLDNIVVQGIIKDVFQDVVPNLDKESSDYGNLKDCIEQSFE